MKRFNKFLMTLLGVMFFTTLQLNAQVTIGSGDKPAKGAILDLKSKTPTDPTADNSTTGLGGGGLLLPRVNLESVTSLNPFMDLDALSTTDQKNEKLLHTGLTVYNISENVANLAPGIYVWDGENWKVTGGGSSEKWFYMPSFPLPLGDVGSTQTVELYKEYTNQFKKTLNTDKWISSDASLTGIFGNEDKVYESDEISYVVTYYDQSVISGISINAEGEMKYKVEKNIDLDYSTAYVNIIIVVKE